jgi:hypothetical protein
VIPARISLTLSESVFVAGSGIARISLAWWDPAEPEGRRDPVLVTSPSGCPRTVVVLWPTDGRGYLDVPRLRRGEVEVRPWNLAEDEIELLRQRARDWPLDRHDLLVRRGWVVPCPETLRTADLGIGLEQRIEAAIARLMG